MSVLGEKITEFVGVVLVCGALALGTPPVANADHHGGAATSVIGKKVVEGTGKVTSITVTEAGPMVNIDATMGERGTAIYTVTFGAPVGAARETGPYSVRGQVFYTDGKNATFTGAGTWRKSGQHQWESKAVVLLSNGERRFVVEAHDLASRSVKTTIYALD